VESDIFELRRFAYDQQTRLYAFIALFVGLAR
jgi:hypothetical protein